MKGLRDRKLCGCVRVRFACCFGDVLVLCSKHRAEQLAAAQAQQEQEREAEQLRVS
jgi:hypothetical protein